MRVVDIRISRAVGRDAVQRRPPWAAVAEAVEVPTPDVIAADGKAGADFAIHADDEFVGPIVLQVWIDGAERRRRPGTCGLPVPGFRQEVRRGAAVQQRQACADEYLARLNDGVVTRVNLRCAA